MVNRSDKMFQLLMLMELVKNKQEFKTAGAPKKQKVSKPKASPIGGGNTAPTAAVGGAPVAAAAVAPAKVFMTMKDVLSKHGFSRQPKCKCFKNYCKSARLEDIDKLLGMKCIDAQKYDTSILNGSDEEQMKLAAYMQEQEDNDTNEYFSWCDKVFYTREFGYDHRGARGCYKQSCF
jgi:hypothetical protein